MSKKNTLLVKVKINKCPLVFAEGMDPGEIYSVQMTVTVDEVLDPEKLREAVLHRVRTDVLPTLIDIETYPVEE